MNRGNIGTTPRPTRLADESYLEFITSFRRLAIQEMFPKVAEHGEVALAKALETGEVEAPADGETVKLSEIRDVFGQNPVTPTFQRFVRTQQEMMWRRTRERDSIRISMASWRRWRTPRQRIPNAFTSIPIS